MASSRPTREEKQQLDGVLRLLKTTGSAVEFVKEAVNRAAFLFDDASQVVDALARTSLDD